MCTLPNLCCCETMQHLVGKSVVQEPMPIHSRLFKKLQGFPVKTPIPAADGDHLGMDNFLDNPHSVPVWSFAAVGKTSPLSFGPDVAESGAFTPEVWCSLLCDVVHPESAVIGFMIKPDVDP